MLLPLMHTNLAQIARIWVATSFLQGKITEHALTTILQTNSYTDNRHLTTSLGDPYNIIEWKHKDNPPESTMQNDNETQSQCPVIKYQNKQTTPSSELNNLPPPREVQIPVYGYRNQKDARFLATNDIRSNHPSQYTQEISDNATTPGRQGQALITDWIPALIQDDRPEHPSKTYGMD